MKLIKLALQVTHNDRQLMTERFQAQAGRVTPECWKRHTSSCSLRSNVPAQLAKTGAGQACQQACTPSARSLTLKVSRVKCSVRAIMNMTSYIRLWL